MFESIGAIALLVICSFFDIRWKKIPIWALVAGGIWGLVSIGIRCVFGRTLLSVAGGTLAAILPGAVFLVLSFLTEKKIGCGDGILLIILGVLEGLKMVSLTCCVGLFMQSLFAVGLVLMKKADKQTCIPFVPFLLVARLIMVIT